MKKIYLNQNQRFHIAETLKDINNITLASAVIDVILNKPNKTRTFLSGIAIFIILFILSVYLKGKNAK